MLHSSVPRVALPPTGTAPHLCWTLGTQQAAPVLGVCKEQKRGDAAATNPGAQRVGTAPPSFTPERRAAVSSISRQDTRDAGDGAQGQQPGRGECHSCSQSSVGRTAGRRPPLWGLSEDQAKCRCVWARSCSRDTLSERVRDGLEAKPGNGSHPRRQLGFSSSPGGRHFWDPRGSSASLQALCPLQ